MLCLVVSWVTKYEPAEELRMKERIDPISKLCENERSNVKGEI